jgi:hypothetical protein
MENPSHTLLYTTRRLQNPAEKRKDRSEMLCCPAAARHKQKEIIDNIDSAIVLTCSFPTTLL